MLTGSQLLTQCLRELFESLQTRTRCSQILVLTTSFRLLTFCQPLDISLRSPLWDVTPHVLRHSFASIANDLGFTEITIAALIGHAKGSVTSKYVHTLDTTLVMAADTVSGYVQALLEGTKFQRNSYTFDRRSRQDAIDRMLSDARAAG